MPTRSKSTDSEAKQDAIPATAHLRARLLSFFGSPLDTRHALKAQKERLVRWLLLALATGVATGLCVALFQYLVSDLALPFLYETRRMWLYMVLPVVGLVLSSLCVRYLVPSREGTLTEAYIRTFHDPGGTMPARNFLGKALSSFITIIFGGNIGLEGPSIFMGATIGDRLEARFDQFFPREDRKMLLVAGAAAGLAAIFKAPLTGLVFAIEVPYKDSVRGRMLIPTFVASGSAYLVSVLLTGSEHIFAHASPQHFTPKDLFMAALLGLCCGIGARMFAWFHHFSKRTLQRMPAYARPLVAGIGVGLLTALVFQLFGEPFLYGPGYRVMHHVLLHTDPLWMLIILLTAKAVATGLTFAGGGTGGMFFPLAVMGAVTGTAFTHFVPGPTAALYPLIGTAAFLGAGYRTPVAAIAFVAETTGDPWALIPAMLAAVCSLIAMGDEGVSENQQALPPLPALRGPARKD